MIARSASDLTREFLGTVLGGGADDVATIDIEPIGTGQLASTVRVRIDWASPNPTRPTFVIVKMAGTETDGRDPHRRIATFRREVGFYRELGSRASLPIPKCFHADADDEGNFTLVMAESPGRTGDQLLGCSPEIAESIVDAAAMIHCSTWGSDATALDFDWLADDDERSAEAERRNRRYAALLPGFLDRYHGRLDEELCLSVARKLDGALATVDSKLKLRRCIVHNDFRLDNMIIDGSTRAPSVTVIDWQTVGIGSGPVDLAYAIGAGLSVDDRRSHESDLVDRYVATLRRTGIGVADDDVWHDYRLGSASGLVMAVIASQVVRRTSRGDEMFAVMAERHATQMTDLDFFDLIDD